VHFVGETNDGVPERHRGWNITREDVFAAIKNARVAPVAEGVVNFEPKQLSLA